MRKRNPREKKFQKKKEYITYYQKSQDWNKIMKTKHSHGNLFTIYI